jgi:oxygen-dependent protoporphyrinogen oxidase
MTAAQTGRLDAVIVGGGVAGLTVARDLAASGHRVHLLEARPRVGGVIVTDREGPFVIEGGPDSMLAQEPAALALCRELGLEAEIVPTRAPRTAFVLWRGTFHPLPGDTLLGIPLTEAALDALTMLSPEGRARMARDLVAPDAPDPSHDDESIGAFFTRRFGPDATRRIAQPLLGGIHAGDVDRLSLRALFPGLWRADRAGGSLLATLRAQRASRDGEGAFRGLRRGMGTLVDRLLASLPAGVVRTGSAAEALRFTADGVEIAGGGTILRARAVVLAVPGYAAARLLAATDSSLASLCESIDYVSSATVTLAYPRGGVAHPLSGMGFIVPPGDPTCRLLAASWVSSKWPGRAPDGVALVRAFVGGAFDPMALDLDDATLAARTHGDLSRLLGVTVDPLLTRVFRWRDASPQYTVGHLGRIAAIDARCANHPGLYLTGSAFRGVGIPDTVADARAVAAAVSAWLIR